MKKKAIGLVTVMTLSVLATACASTKNESQSTDTKQPVTTATTAVAEKEEKLTITMMSRSYAGGGWPDNHASVKYLNDKFNIDLKLLWIPVDNYVEKLNVLAASNDLPDAFYIDPEFFTKWSTKNVFMDLKPQLAKYPNLAKVVPDQLWKALNPKDKYLGIPLWSESNRDSLVIRKDWLDKLGLKEPQTVDEFYEVAKAFTTKDPDGNGKQDTYGFTFYPQQMILGGIYGPDYLEAAFSLANGWKEESGKLVPVQTQTNELKSYVTFLNKAYQEGVLDKDFFVNKQNDPEGKFYAGKAGISYVNTNNLFSTVIPSVKKSDSKAEIVQLTPPAGPTGQRGTVTFDNVGGQKIVFNAKSDPKVQDRLLKMYDWLSTEEGYDFAKHGVPDVHYKKVSANQFEKLPATDTDIPKKLRWLWIKPDPLHQLYKFDNPKDVEVITQWINNNEKYTWVNKGAGLVSPTLAEKGKEINGKWLDALVQVIYGKEPIEYVDKAVASWKASGGDTIIQEINAAYQATK
jgi:putative aldouronate transport system substrate-binding protein